MRKSRFFAMTSILIIVLIAIVAVGCSYNQSSTESQTNPNTDKYTINYGAFIGGTIVGETVQIVEHGENSQPVEAVPDEGYIFVEWSDGNSDSVRFEKNITENLAFTARFEVFAAETFSIVYDTTEGGSINGDVRQTVKPGASGSSVTAIAQPGYEFVEWSDGVKSATRQDPDVKANMQVKALFGKKEYSVIYSVDGCGVIDGATEQTVEYGDNASAVTAKPRDEYYFVEWSDGVKSATRQDTDIKANKNVTAIFHKYYWLRYVSYDNSDGGVISGDDFQYIKHGENGSTVTAIPKEGYEFECWDDGNTDPQRTDVNITKHRTYTAYFKRKVFKVDYIASKGGWISHVNRVYSVNYGEQSSTVRVMPNKGYVFVEWSDGLTTPERTEYNVKSDMTFTAYFGYGAEYKVNNGVGGKIAGKTSQAVRAGCDFDEVEAVPDEGYVFGGWSDLRNESKRKDTNAERGIEHIAYFEPIERTFKYDYGIASGIPMASSVTFNRNNIELDGYPTPTMAGYTFEGWYTDKDYKVKAINSEGIYMLGYYGFSEDTDTLYARWKPINDTAPVYKILLFFVDEIHAHYLYINEHREECVKDVHYKMTSIEKEFFGLAHLFVLNSLSEGLSDIVNIEVDSYYTTQTVDEKYLKYHIYVQPRYFGLSAEDLPEMQIFQQSYNSILSTYNVDKEGGGAGSAMLKYAEIYAESLYIVGTLGNRFMQQYLSEVKVGVDIEIGLTMLHELTHTCAKIYPADYLVHLHEIINKSNVTDKEMYILYLRGEFEYKNALCGIPRDFWTNRATTMLKLTPLEASLYKPQA